MSKVPFQQVTNHAILAFCMGLPSQLNLIRLLKSEMDREWDQLRDSSTRVHLIEDVGFAPTKTDAMKIYVEKISGLVFSSKGGWQRGFTNKQVSEKHEIISASLGKLNTVPVTHKSLFVELTTSLFGYDKRLVQAALAESDNDEAKEIVAYLATRFDLVAESFEGEVSEDPFEGMYNGSLLKYFDEYAGELYLKMSNQLEQDDYTFFRTILLASKKVDS